MAQQFELISWSFELDDFGTHGQEDGYQGKLNKLKDGWNTAITAINAQLQAGDDSAAIKGQIEQIRDVDINGLLNQIIELRDETLQIKNDTNAISVSEMNGLDVDFNSIKLNGVDVLLSNQTAVNAAKFNNLFATQFLRSDVADTKSANQTFADNIRIFLGNIKKLGLFSNGANAIADLYDNAILYFRDVVNGNRTIASLDPDDGSFNLHYGAFFESGQRVYSPNNKPSEEELGYFKQNFNYASHTVNLARIARVHEITMSTYTGTKTFNLDFSTYNVGDKVILDKKLKATDTITVTTDQHQIYAKNGDSDASVFLKQGKSLKVEFERTINGWMMRVY